MGAGAGIEGCCLWWNWVWRDGGEGSSSHGRRGDVMFDKIRDA